jgi:hypothetical protein
MLELARKSNQYKLFPVPTFKDTNSEAVQILQKRILTSVFIPDYYRMNWSDTKAVWKLRGLTLLLRVGTLSGCGDGLFFEVPPLASDTLLTTLHPLLENVLQTVFHRLQEDSGTGGAPFSWLEKPRNRMGRDLNRMADVLMEFYRSTFSKPNAEFNRTTLTFL